MPPRQIEFAKLYLTNVVTGKRYIKKLVEEGIVDGWDDPQTGIYRSTEKKRIYTGIHQDVCGDRWVYPRATALLTMQCLSTVSVKILKTEDALV